MAKKYILDTHALIWYLEGNSKLGRRAKITMRAADSLMVLPIIALAEAAFLIERGRVGIPTVQDLLTDIKEDNRIQIYPLNWDVFERSFSTAGLEALELHDRLIVGTGIHLQHMGDNVEIITRDEVIANAGILPVIW